jgi:hypothetical protein
MGCEEFRERMLDVLYGEADAGATREWDVHQQGCAACAAEIRALRRLRRDLGAWTAPGPRGAVATVRRAPSWLPLAASVVLAAGGAAALLAAQQRVDRLAAELQVQDQRHRAEIEALRASVTGGRRGDEATLEDVRRLIRESETRQTVVLDASLRGLANRSDAQRREDLAQVSAGLSYLEGRTGLQVARTTELMGHVLQASQRK